MGNLQPFIKFLDPSIPAATRRDCFTLMAANPGGQVAPNGSYQR